MERFRRVVEWARCGHNRVSSGVSLDCILRLDERREEGGVPRLDWCLPESNFVQLASGIKEANGHQETSVAKRREDLTGDQEKAIWDDCVRLPRNQSLQNGSTGLESSGGRMVVALTSLGREWRIVVVRQTREDRCARR